LSFHIHPCRWVERKKEKNEIFRLGKRQVPITSFFIGLAYQGKDIVFKDSL
jgi:hypothetical protein